MDIFSEFVSAVWKCGLNQSLTRLNTQRCEILDSVELDLLAQYRLTKINLTHDRIFQLDKKTSNISISVYILYFQYIFYFSIEQNWYSNSEHFY